MDATLLTVLDALAAFGAENDARTRRARRGC
jgi:hypothetical protein